MTERQIFTQAVEITEPARREEFLSQACGADHALRARVDELLAAHLAANSQFLETPVVDQLQESTDPGTEKTVALPPRKGGEEDEEELPGQPDLNFLQPSTKPGSIGTLGHYEILSILGHGAFGIVFKAFDEKLHRHVAIKMMSAQIAATSPARKRFLREARAAAAIRHDNVTQVYSVEEEPVPYLVMEFIDGQTLQSKQRKQGPLEIPELLHIGRQIAAGLAAAHEKSLIHRDVKPGNILLEQGAEQKVKITDFGLARAADDASLTRSGMISGTPLYMAPEQALGGTLDGRSDLFSLGSVLYELATGRPPFRAPTTVAVLRRVVDDTPRPMREIIPELPEWFVTIVTKLLEKQPEKRYQSAKEVAELFARCQSELQLSGQVTCVPGAGSVSARSTSPGTNITPASVKDSGGSRPPLSGKPSYKSLLLSLLLGVLVVSPILFGKKISSFISPLIWGQIPTLPIVERAAGLRFDGKDDFIQVPVQWDTPVFTIEAFVTSEEGVPSGTLLHLSNEKRAGIESIELFDEQNQAGQPQSFAGVVGGKSQGYLAAPLQRGVRQHRVLTFDGDHLHYYVNGMWQAKRHVLPEDQLIWKLRQLTIGCKQDRTNFFAGVIDQLRISKVVRYKNNFAPITSVTSDDSTLALYDFDEGTGDVLRDSSGNRADGKILGATWVHPAKGLQFDGVDDYIDFETLGWSSNQYTFETWITPLAEHGTLFQIAVPEGNVHAYLYEGGSGSGLNRDKSYTNVNGPRAGMKRQHLATVFDGKNLSYFIDGKLAGSKTNVSDLTTPWTFQRLRIGGKLDPNSSKPEFFHGRMEQFRVSKSALYVLPFTPEETLQRTADTIALYNFDENQGAVLKDATGHGHDGKIVGATWVKPSSMAGSVARTFHSGEWIDAVSLIDPGSDKFDLPGMTGRNDWKREGNHLVVGPDKLASKLVLPLDSTWSAFECELEFTRRSGAGGLNLNLPTRTGECSVVIDHASGNGGVFLGARDKGVVLSEGKKIEGGKHTTLNVTVRRVQNQDQITVSLNGKATGQWTGNRNDIGKESTERFPVSRRISLWIHEGNNEFEFHRIRLRPLDGETITTTRPQTGWHGWPEDAPEPAIAPFSAEQAKKYQEEWAAYLKVPVEYTNSIGMKFRLIPPGEFTMGSTPDDISSGIAGPGHNEDYIPLAQKEGPQKRVTIAQPFYLGVHEVSQRQLTTLYPDHVSHFSARSSGTDKIPGTNADLLPADSVDFARAQEFCEVLSRREGRIESANSYYIPTEAEWEYAARGGTQLRFLASDLPDELKKAAWCVDNSGAKPHVVGTLPANPFGLHDMLGNVWEWSADGWLSVAAPTVRANVWNQASQLFDAKQRVMRGGGWTESPIDCRIGRRFGIDLASTNLMIGFRVALSVEAVRKTLGYADAPKPAIAPFTAEQAKQHQTAWASYLKVPAEFTDKHGMKFVLIPPGEFQMGLSQTELDTLTRELKQAGANEFDLFSASTSGPQHRVRITQPIYMSAHEVTIAQYRAFLEETKYLPTADQLGGKMKWTNFVPKENPDSYPVDGVSWTDADSFCTLRSQRDGVTYRLPSEAEWEFACRAGTTTLWSFGDNPGQLGEYAATTSAGVTQLQPVGSRKPNAFGLFDMYCNAEEWCRDWHVRDYYAQSPVDDPVYLEAPSDANSGRVTRGGSLSSAVWITRSSLRRWDYPSTPVSPKGFRVVISGDLKKSVKAISPPDDREVAEWILSQKGRISTYPSIGHDVTEIQDLPATPFVITSLEVSVKADSFSDTDLSRIGQLSNVGWILVNGDSDRSKVTEAGLEAFSQSPAGRSVFSLNLPSINNLSDKSIQSFNRMTQLSKVILPGTQFTDEGIRQLRLPNLKELNMGGSQVTHASLKPLLENNPKLETLFLWGTDMSGPGLMHLQSHPIKALWLMQQKLTDDDLKVLAGVTSLEYVNLGDTQGFTPQGLKELLKLPSLGGLHLFGLGSLVNDETVEALAEIRTLQDLQIGKSDVTDAGLKHLTQLSSITTLGLGYTRISDAGLEMLGQIKTLKKLYINNCENITEVGVQKLRESLPECEIISDFTGTPQRPMVSDPVSPSSQWSAPVNLGSAINTPAREANPSLTSDELLLVFTRGEELFEARRASRDEPFAPATKLAGPLPSAKFLTSCLSGDGLQLVLSAIPPGGNAQDVMITTRASRDDPFGQPVALPQSINAPGEDRHPVLSPDGLILALTSVRGGQQTGGLLIFTRPNPTAEFNPTPTVDARLQGSWSVINSFSSDGRGLLKTTMADNVETITWHTRTADSPDWSEGQPLPAPFDAIKFGAPFLSTDGNTIYFHSRYVPDGQGDLDLWVSRRTMKTP